jgi:hypothetical protein
MNQWELSSFDGSVAAGCSDRCCLTDQLSFVGHVSAIERTATAGANAYKKRPAFRSAWCPACFQFSAALSSADIGQKTTQVENI